MLLQSHIEQGAAAVSTLSSEMEKMTLMGLMGVIVVGLIYFIRFEKKEHKVEKLRLTDRFDKEIDELKAYANSEKAILREEITTQTKYIVELQDQKHKQGLEFTKAITQMQEREQAREDRAEEKTAMFETKLDGKMVEFQRSLTDIARLIADK
jgi:hypothetical protein